MKHSDGYSDEPFIIQLQSESDFSDDDYDDGELWESSGPSTSSTSSGIPGVQPFEDRHHDHNYFYKI